MEQVRHRLESFCFLNCLHRDAAEVDEVYAAAMAIMIKHRNLSDPND